jgi:hypothetical protein
MAIDDTIRGGKRIADALGGLFGRAKGTTSAFNAADANKALKADALAVIRRGEGLLPGQTVRGAINTARKAARVERKANKAVNPSYLSTLPWWAKLGGVGGIGALGLGATALFGGKTETPEYDWAG